MKIKPAPHYNKLYQRITGPPLTRAAARESGSISSKTAIGGVYPA